MSCSSTKNIPADQLVLVKNNLVINSTDQRIDRSAVKKDITSLIKQLPIKKNVLNPRTYGKPLTIFDETLTRESAESMEQFLQNKRGFYHARVTYDLRKEGKKISVAYILDLGERYYINSVSYDCQDDQLCELASPESPRPGLSVGDPLDATSFDIERIRIINLLKDRGYANFNTNYIEIRGDSSNHQVDVSIFIYNPPGRSKHTRFRIGDINVYTEHVPAQNPIFAMADTLDDRVYFSRGDKFIVKPKNISNVLTLNKGDVFRKSAENKSNRNLSRLSPYRFVVMDPFLHNDNDSLYNYNIFLQPHRNKWVLDMGANFFYSTISQIGRNLFGFTGNVGIQNRNFRNSATRYTLGLEGTFEFEISDFPRISANSLSSQLNNTFEIPRVIDIFKITNILNKFNLIDDDTIDKIDENGTTKIEIGMGMTSILDFYTLNTFNASWSYDFQPNPRLRYNIRQIGLNVVYTDVKSRFEEEILQNNPLLRESFSDNLFTGFFFRELSIYKRTRETKNGAYMVFLGNFELSGFENFLVNRLVNGLTSYNEWWKLSSLEFAEFVSLEADLRLYKKVKSRSSFASRINLAIALPYGNDEFVPYIKQYFVGGPNSIRGWQLRELGPGAYSEYLLNPRENQPYFQTGDIKIEFSAEYRFDLFWMLEAAVFLDGGNVWTLKSDADRPNAQFSTSFFDQMALSTGWGLRWDFDYFLFRFDFGYKLRNPFPDPEDGSYFILTDGRYNGILGNINFAINYPF